MNYQPPIMITDEITNHISENLEKCVLEVVSDFGIKVDKEELLKALRYDRNQYNRGYDNGLHDAVTHAHWIKFGHYPPTCSHCGIVAEKDCEGEEFVESNYCPYCGAKMDEEVHDND